MTQFHSNRLSDALFARFFSDYGLKIPDNPWERMRAYRTADDVMGIMASIPNTEAIIVSDDKDMKTIPCRLYRPNDNDRLVISDMEANKNFLIQALMGDMTDGYGGCPKVGIKTAEKILGNHPTWDAVIKQYQKEKL